MQSPTWNLLLIALSYVISVFGSYVALHIAAKIPGAAGRTMWWRVFGAAVALGGGAIWAMHFIGMLAYQISLPVYYDPLLTLASLALAIGVCAAALLLAGRGQGGVVRLVGSGLLAGAGVAGMHYTGMAGMQIAGATMSYVPWLVVVSIAIAVAAAIAALWLASNSRGTWKQLGSAFVMGLAVCGMHYTGMAAVVMSTSEAKGGYAPVSVLQERDLGFSVFLAAFVVLCIALIVSLGETREREDTASI
jgi:NO-binding membrane sensor protein with MHYT domain